MIKSKYNECSGVRYLCEDQVVYKATDFLPAILSSRQYDHVQHGG